MKVEPRTLWKAIVEEATHTGGGGSLPSSWRWVKLGDVVELNPRNHLPDDMPVSFLTMEQITAGLEGKYTTSVRNWGEVRKNFTHFKDGDVIVAKITPCFQNRKSALVSGLTNGYGAGTTELHVLRAKECVLNKYIYYLVKSEYFIFRGANNMQGTAGQKRIRTPFIKNVLIPLPPIDEQREIIARLEPLLREVEELDEHYQRYKHAKEVFRKSAIQAAVHAKDEELPAGWRWVRLGEVCTMTNGRAFKPSEWSKEGLPIVRIQNLNNPREEYHYFAGDVKSCHLLEGRELLFAWSASIGVYVWNGGNAVLNQHIFKVEANDMTMNGYIRYVLEAQLLKIKNLTHGTTMKHIRKCTLESIPFPLPPIDQQSHIVSYLDNLTHQLDIMP